MKRHISFFAVLFVCAGMSPGLPEAATLTGQVNFTGTAPQPQEISMNADPSCAALYDEPVYIEDVIVNENGTLKNVFVYIKEGLEGQKFDTPKEAVTLDQEGCRYKPHVFGVQVNQPIEIINSDATLHNVHAMPQKQREFNLGMPIKGMKLKRQFSEPEVMITFKCDVHPWMRAYAGVLPHPFYSVTGEEGRFEIANLPPGTYTLEAWHEKYGTQTQQITVTDEGASIDFTYEG